MVIHVHLPNCLDFDEKEKKENFLLHVINYPQDKKNIHWKNVEAYVMSNYPDYSKDRKAVLKYNAMEKCKENSCPCATFILKINTQQLSTEQWNSTQKWKEFVGKYCF